MASEVVQMARLVLDLGVSDDRDTAVSLIALTVLQAKLKFANSFDFSDTKRNHKFLNDPPSSPGHVPLIEPDHHQYPLNTACGKFSHHYRSCIRNIYILVSLLAFITTFIFEPVPWPAFLINPNSSAQKLLSVSLYQFWWCSCLFNASMTSLHKFQQKQSVILMSCSPRKRPDYT